MVVVGRWPWVARRGSLVVGRGVRRRHRRGQRPWVPMVNRWRGFTCASHFTYRTIAAVAGVVGRWPWVARRGSLVVGRSSWVARRGSWGEKTPPPRPATVGAHGPQVVRVHLCESLHLPYNRGGGLVVVGRWSWVAGRGSLVVGRWPWVAGCGLLAVGRGSWVGDGGPAVAGRWSWSPHKSTHFTVGVRGRDSLVVGRWSWVVDCCAYHVPTNVGIG